MDGEGGWIRRLTDGGEGGWRRRWMEERQQLRWFRKDLQVNNYEMLQLKARRGGALPISTRPAWHPAGFDVKHLTPEQQQPEDVLQKSE